MVKVKFWSIILVTLSLLVSCGNNDEENENDVTTIAIAYDKVKAGIIGLWYLDAYYNPWTIEEPKVSKGWDTNLTWLKYLQENSYYSQYGGYGQYNSSIYDYETFVDSNWGNGSLTYMFTEKEYWSDNSSHKSYSILLDTDRKVLCGKDGDKINWPYSKGAILITDGKGVGSYVEIKADGMLYLYNRSYTGKTADTPFTSQSATEYTEWNLGDGVPVYRYRRK